MTEGEPNGQNFENKSSDSSVPEYAALSPLRESCSEVGKDENSPEGEKESVNDEQHSDSAKCEDSESDEITEKENEEVRSECDGNEVAKKGEIDEDISVKDSNSEEVVNNETREMEVTDKSEVVDVSSKHVDSKVIGEISKVHQETDSDECSDTSADESESDEISHSRTLTDSDVNDVGNKERKKKLTKVKVKIEPQDSSCKMLNVQIKNKDDQSNCSKSMSTSYGDEKEEADVTSTEWYRVCTQSQGGKKRGNDGHSR